MGKQVVGGVVVAILLSIIILNGTKTGQVIKAISDGTIGFAKAVNGAGA